MQFTRLRLQGFKSFVEPSELEIAPGLTGIVGPNGCGKSNLVEALRWVMGENSPKRMRGSEMDDVIFGGTATRPSRNLAEVALELDNTGRSAIAEFNNEDTLLVSRKIERGEGSEYRINGKPVRQRDMQLLFADQATGAHSTNLVGQGQIDALIRAKPQDRRQILEEASGTAGLQARRHEAELKLKAAEQNLLRLDDVLKTYDTQLRNLKQQIRQASRYRNLAEHIRKTEAALLHLRWLEAEQNAESLKTVLQAAEQRANELLAVVTQGATKRTEIAAELPSLRSAETAAAAIVQKMTLAREQIEAETKRVADEMKELEQRMAQASSDQEREQIRRTDAETAITKLQGEQEELTKTSTDIAAQLPNVLFSLANITQEVEALDRALTEFVQAAANAEARKKSLQEELATLSERRDTLSQKREQLDRHRAGLAAEVASRPDLSFAVALVDASEKELDKKQQQARQAEDTYRQGEHLQNQARDIAQIMQAKATKLRAEEEAILALLQQDPAESAPVIDLITVTPGLENALAVALGEALTAALDAKAAMHWRAMKPLDVVPPLPHGVTPISQYIDAPAALARSLSQVGLVENENAGENASHYLQPGQIIVSRDGWAWRWDGFTVTPQAKTTTALRLQQRNRLAALKNEIADADAEARKAEWALKEATSFFTQRQAEDKQAREALQAAFAALNDARETYSEQEKESTALTSKLKSVDENLQQVIEDLNTIETRVTAIEEEQKTLPNIEVQNAAIADKRTALTEARNRQAQYQSERDRLTHEQNICDTRRTAVAQDIEAWQSRLDNANQQLQELAERINAIQTQHQSLQTKPAELAAARDSLLSELSEAEARRKEAADRLIETEQRLSVVEHQLKQDEASLSNAREEKVRAEGNLQTSEEHFNSLRERAREKLDCAPEQLLEIAAFEGELPNVFELDQALARYLRERENMGPVNLRAETEADTMQGEIDKLQKEKDDLVAAIAKLRQGISQLNREARERLQNAFGLVNDRFQTLFKRLFNGGRAHLELIDAEDPLNAGLEIFASPPGKKLQILSLLSGGERTLTALALLFAVFQTNPSPICVLDEAEAALDESNIDRFCQLVEDIGRETGTRFLIITHQRLTMARMDRLYGVTMGEKGVSQLVSVDLAGAVAIRDGADADQVTKAEDALEAVKAA